MKTKEELNKLKEEVETLSKKLAELNEEELKVVAGGKITGGGGFPFYNDCPYCGSRQRVSAGPYYKGMTTYACSKCGGLMDEDGHPIDESETFK